MKILNKVTGMLHISERVARKAHPVSFEERSHKGAIVSEHSRRHSETAFRRICQYHLINKHYLPAQVLKERFLLKVRLLKKSFFLRDLGVRKPLKITSKIASIREILVMMICWEVLDVVHFLLHIQKYASTANFA